MLGFTYHSLASKRGNGKKYETFVPRTTVGLQCKLFQSLDRRETIVVFQLNGHQTKFVCEVLVLGIRKKINTNFVKRKNSQNFKVFQLEKQGGFGIHSELFWN